ncbi:MAG: hypothetical protein R2911_11935 [Caldilineaceae bacterium]
MEPGPSLEVEINLDKWNALPEIYQEIVKTAAFEANMTMLARYDARNNEALEDGRAARNCVDIVTEILTASQTAAFELYDEYSAADSDFDRIFKEWNAFRQRIIAWHNINEGSFTRFIASQL